MSTSTGSRPSRSSTSTGRICPVRLKSPVISSGRPGKRVDRHVLLACDLDDALAHLAGSGRNRDEKLVRAAVAEQLGELGGRAEHANAVQAQVLLARVVVDQTDRRVAERRILQHLAQDQLRGVAGADEHDLLAARDESAGRRPLDQGACEQARSCDEGEQHEEVDEPDAARNARGVEVEQREDEEGGDGRRRDAAYDPPHVLRRDIAPPAVVEAEREEHRQLDREDQREDVPVEVAVVVDGAGVAVEAHVPGDRPGGDDQERVGGDLPEPVPVDRRAHRSRPTRGRRAPRARSRRPAPVAPP